MRAQPTLRRELVTAFALLFAGALLVALVGMLWFLPIIEDSTTASAYVIALLAGDLVVFTLFGRWLIRNRMLRPLDELVGGVEAIAEGDYERRLAVDERRELARVAEAVNLLASRLIRHQEELAENIRSLQVTNRELTEARNELVQAEKMASVGRLAAGIAHEVGNPLGSVMGYLGLLGRQVGEEKRELIVAAEAEARRIDRIIHGLLDYARPREVNPRPIAVTDVAREALDLLGSQGRLDGIELVTAFGEELPRVRVDAYRLQQVLVNLLLNAIDAMEGRPKRRLEIRTASQVVEPPRRMPIKRRDDPPGIDYSHRRRFHQRPRLPREHAFPAGDAVRIDIADTGTGIPDDLLETLFEPFVTTKEPGKGTGLGLAVAARLIDAMGGTILVDSKIGWGSTFSVLLPVADHRSQGSQ